MSTPQPEQGDLPAGRKDEEPVQGTQHSQRMLNFSDALLSIIATVMVCEPLPGEGRGNPPILRPISALFVSLCLDLACDPHGYLPRTGILSPSALGSHPGHRRPVWAG